MSNSTPLQSLRKRRPAAWLRERDIDLLICSELYFEGGPLQRLFLDGWNDGIATFGGAWVSHSDADGETDIVVSFESESGFLALLVENKIDAQFQPEQPERYRERARRWMAVEGPQVKVKTVLLAPAAYFDNEGSEVFDWQVSYEDLIQVLDEADDPRTRFLALMLGNGLEAHRDGYVKIKHEVNSQVWNSIWEIAHEQTPRLRMRKPGSKPAGAGFIYFYDADGVSRSETGGRAHIVYKNIRNEGCAIDIQIGRMTLAALEAQVGGLLESDMFVVQAGGSASIRVPVPFVNFAMTPEGQEKAIEQGLYAAERLRTFFVEKGLIKVVD